jgi:hypothetical protein
MSSAIDGFERPNRRCTVFMLSRFLINADA